MDKYLQSQNSWHYSINKILDILASQYIFLFLQYTFLVLNTYLFLCLFLIGTLWSSSYNIAIWAHSYNIYHFRVLEQRENVKRKYVWSLAFSFSDCGARAAPWHLTVLSRTLLPPGVHAASFFRAYHVSAVQLYCAIFWNIQTLVISTSP